MVTSIFQRFRDNARLFTWPITLCSAADAGIDVDNTPMDTHTVIVSGDSHLTLPEDKDEWALISLRASSVEANCSRIELSVNGQLLLAADGNFLDWAGFLVPHHANALWTLSARNANNEPVHVLLSTEWAELNEEQRRQYVHMEQAWTRAQVGNVWLLRTDRELIVDAAPHEGARMLKEHTVHPQVHFNAQLFQEPTDTERDAAAWANVQKLNDLQALGRHMVMVVDGQTGEDVLPGQW